MRLCVSSVISHVTKIQLGTESVCVCAIQYVKALLFEPILLYSHLTDIVGFFVSMFRIEHRLTLLLPREIDI